VGRQNSKQESNFEQVTLRDATAPKNTKLGLNQNMDSGTFPMPYLFIYFTVVY
jgi:hypothetical protein